MEGTALSERTGAAEGNGTHPDGIGEDEARERAAQVLGLEKGQLSFAVGGKRPDTSKLKLAGRSIEIPGGQLQKGDEYTIQARIRVGGIHFDDKINSATEEVTGCTRKQIARIVGDVTVVNPGE
jgi:hypothetical protein